MTNGKQILEGLAQTRNFFRQLSLLLRAVDGLLYEAGWENIGGNKTSDMTSHVHKPERWMPQDIYRFYVESEEEGEGNRGLVAFFGVLLDRDGAWAGFKEPWMTTGVYQFHKDKDPRQFRFWHWVAGALDHQYEPDGSFHEWECPQEEILEYEDLVYYALMALPLVEITDEESVKRRVIDPLLEKIRRIVEYRIPTN